MNVIDKNVMNFAIFIDFLNAHDFFLSLQSMFDGAHCLSNGFIFSLFVIVFFFKYSYALKVVKPY